MGKTSLSMMYGELLEGSYEECEELGLTDYLEDEIASEEREDNENV